MPKIRTSIKPSSKDTRRRRRPLSLRPSSITDNTTVTLPDPPAVPFVENPTSETLQHGDVTTDRTIVNTTETTVTNAAMLYDEVARIVSFKVWDEVEEMDDEDGVVGDAYDERWEDRFLETFFGSR